MENEETNQLQNELERRGILCSEYRRSFFEVITLFGPTIFAIVDARCRQRDARLTAEANRAIAVQVAEGGSGANEARIRLKTQLELQKILQGEYRDSYFTAIKLVGSPTFNFVEDRHQQRDGVIEGEAARVDDMVEKIWHAADPLYV